MPSNLLNLVIFLFATEQAGIDPGSAYRLERSPLVDEVKEPSYPSKSILQHPSRVNCISVSPDARHMTSTIGHLPNACWIWDVESAHKLREVGNPLAVGQALFLPNGRDLILASQYLQICDYTSGHNVYLHPTPFEGFVNSMAYCENKKYVAIAGMSFAPTYVLLFDFSSRKEIKRFSVPFRSSTSVALSVDGILLAVAGGDPGKPKDILVWDTESKREFARIDGKDEAFNCISFLPNKSFLISGSNSDDTSLKLWEIAHPESALTFPSQQKRVRCIALSPDARNLASGGNEGSVCLWAINSGKLRTKLDGHNGAVNGLAFFPDGRRLASCGDDGNVIIWNLPSLIKATEKAKHSRKQDLQSLWNVLAGDNAAEAYAAIWKFVQKPGDGVQFLREHVKQDSQDPLIEKRVRSIVSRLDSSKFEVRQQASKELEGLGEVVGSHLKAIAITHRSLEVRRRIGRILDELHSPFKSGDKLQKMRAIEALELIGNNEALIFLEELSAGAEGSLISREAKNAVERIRKKNGR